MRGLPQCPPLRKPGTETVATSFEEKEEILRAKFFPLPPAAHLEDIENYVYPSRVPSTEHLWLEEVVEAIARPSPDKTPGVSNITNRILQLGIGEIGPVLHHLFQACLKLGYHPLIYRKARTAVLKKPRKSDYTDPKAWRPIALLDCMGKALETIVARRISKLAEDNELLPGNQMGARRQRSTESALELLVEQVYTIWNHGPENVATVLSLDVAGAFDNVSHHRLPHNLRKRKIPEYLVTRTKCFLEDRQTSLSFGGRTEEMQPVSAGIPQGSPVSPILFLFFHADLVETCQNLGPKSRQCSV